MTLEKRMSCLFLRVATQETKGGYSGYTQRKASTGESFIWSHEDLELIEKNLLNKR